MDAQSFLNDDDDLFGGTPEKKFYDIVFNANRNLVTGEINQILEKLAATELLLEDVLGADKDVEQIIENYRFENQGKVNHKIIDLYIGSTASILTQNE